METKQKKQTKKTAEPAKKTIDLLSAMTKGYFCTIKNMDSGCDLLRIAYAKDTKVKYFISMKKANGTITAICPLYNRDGSLQIHNG